MDSSTVLSDQQLRWAHAMYGLDTVHSSSTLVHEFYQLIQRSIAESEDNMVNPLSETYPVASHCQKFQGLRAHRCVATPDPQTCKG